VQAERRTPSGVESSKRSPEGLRPSAFKESETEVIDLSAKLLCKRNGASRPVWYLANGHRRACALSLLMRANRRPRPICYASMQAERRKPASVASSKNSPEGLRPSAFKKSEPEAIDRSASLPCQRNGASRPVTHLANVHRRACALPLLMRASRRPSTDLPRFYASGTAQAQYRQIDILTVSRKLGFGCIGFRW